MRFKLGCVASKPDERDYRVLLAASEPTSGYDDLREYMPAIWDQGRKGSCTAHGIGGNVAYDYKKNLGMDFDPSRLDIYWKERFVEGTVWMDSGAQIRDGIKVINKWGVCPEAMWPYSDGPFKFRMKPPRKCWDEAVKYTALEYAQVPIDGPTIKQVISSKYPVVIGVLVYESFVSKDALNTGMIPTPDPTKEKQLGGHCMCVCGFDDNKGLYIVRNSWGTGVGDKGYFYMGYDYVNNASLGSDYWVIRSMGGQANIPLNICKPLGA